MPTIKTGRKMDMNRSNESPDSSQNYRSNEPIVISSMTRAVKLLQEELWIRKWESKNVRYSEEKSS